MVEARHGPAAVRDLLAERGFPHLHLADAALIGLHDRRRVGLDDPVKELCDLALDGAELAARPRGDRLARCETRVPELLEHGTDEVEQRGLGLEGCQNLAELGLHALTRNRLAITHAAARMAHVVGIALRAAFRPARRERPAAFPAQDEAPEREVGIQVLARRNPHAALDALLNLFERPEADEPRVPTGAQAHAPIGKLDVARIDGPREHVRDLLVAHLTIRALGKGRLIFQEGFHFRLTSKTAIGETFKRLGDDGSIGLIAHQHLALTADRLVAVAHRRLKNPIPVHRAGAHAVFGLLGVLLALVRGDGGKHVLNQPAVRVVAELDGRAFENAARRGNLESQLEMRVQVPREPADVVDDDHVRIGAALAHVRQHRLQAGPVEKRAGHVVLEDLGDLKVLEAGIFAAARLLGFETGSARGLFGV